jgi:hypothetical protein
MGLIMVSVLLAYQILLVISVSATDPIDTFFRFSSARDILYFIHLTLFSYTLVFDLYKW